MSHQPTTDLYFRNVLTPHIARWWRRGPIRQVGANSFIAGDWFVLIRRDTPHQMREALAWPGRLAYVIDDDVAGAASCAALPEAYRARLAEFERRFHRDLLVRSDVVLTASDALSATLATDRRMASRLRRIDPVWRQPLADLAHFAPLATGATLRMVQLGTGSHRAALATIAPQVARVLDRHPDTSFTYFSARRVCDTLETHPRARRLDPMTWREYQRWMARHRFHLALYPLDQTRFDRARSANKITEHAILGAVGLYPEGWRPAQRLGDGAALFAPDDPEAWEEAIEAALAERPRLSHIAAEAAQTLANADPTAAQQAVWSDILGLDLT